MNEVSVTTDKVGKIRKRRIKYSPTICKKLEKLLILGLTDEQIAENIGCHRDTIYEWQRRHAIVATTFEKFRELAHSRVAQSLYKRANGYNLRKKKVETDGNGSVMKETVERVHFPPDVEAAKFILSRRHPSVWPADQSSISVETNTTIAGVPEDVLNELRKAARRTAGFEHELPEITNGGSVSI